MFAQCGYPDADATQVRRGLKQTHEPVAGLYEGSPTRTTERRSVQEFPSIGAIQTTYPSSLDDRRIKVAKVYAHPLPAPRDWLPVRYAATRCASAQRQALVTPNIAVDGALASGDRNLAWFVVAP